MIEGLPLAKVWVLPLWRVMLALLLAGACVAGLLACLWNTGINARQRLAVMLGLLGVLVVLLAVVWLFQLTLPMEHVEAEPATIEVWLVRNVDVAGLILRRLAGEGQWTGY